MMIVFDLMYEIILEVCLWVQCFDLIDGKMIGLFDIFKLCGDVFFDCVEVLFGECGVCMVCY